MIFSEKEILESLASSRILSSMITPAVLISACGTLLLSTATRLGRVFDRVNVMKSEIEALERSGEVSELKNKYFNQQLALQRFRAKLIQKSMAFLYLSTLLFTASSLGIAFNIAYGRPEHGWIPTMIAILGAFSPFTSVGFLFYESKYNLKFVIEHIDFVNTLHKSVDKTKER